MSDKNIAKKIEDMRLGYIAKERDSKSKSSDYIDLDKVERKLKKSEKGFSHKKIYKKVVDT